MRIVLIFALLFVAACSDGTGRYEQYGPGGYPHWQEGRVPPLVLDTKTGCLFAVEREQWVEVTTTEQGKMVPKKGEQGEKYGLLLRPLDKERC